MKIRCLIVDDEPLAIEVIVSYLDKFNEVEIVESCRNAVHAMEILKRGKIDLMFLDIQMPLLKGTDFLRSLTRPPKVILTTAFREFALEGYELNVLDYLLKPISFERFVQAMDKYFQMEDLKPSVSPVFHENNELNYINVKSDRKIVRLQVDSIIYLECKKDYVQIMTTGEKLLTNVPIYKLEEQLPAGSFLRIHRSFIVSTKYITAFNSEIIEIGEKQLPIGRYYKKRVLEQLN